MRVAGDTYEDVAAVASSLCAGSVVLGEEGHAVGPLTEAVPSRWSWSVTGLQGQTLVLAHDAFEAARLFCLLEASPSDYEGQVVIFSSDAHDAAMRQYENWMYTYRFMPFGDPKYEPSFPVE